MSRKRPRQSTASPALAPPSKADPSYWESRLYRNSYVYRGQKRQVRNWSVKIQYRGKRRAFSLRSTQRRPAAVEACRLYNAVAKQGWDAIERLAKGHSEAMPSEPLKPSYWAHRLVHRQYAMGDHLNSEKELSARIEHAGASSYFPLDTDDRPAAADRAAQIYRQIAGRNEMAACQQFRRELTVAFRWLDNPLMWSYTTIHTQPERAEPAAPAPVGADPFELAIVEADPGLRRALAWCIDQVEGVRCSLAVRELADLLPHLPNRPLRLVLLNLNHLEKPSREELLTPHTTGRPIATLRYSVCQDSEELFKTTPGGAPFYLLRRTPATGLLEPIGHLLHQHSLSTEEMTLGAWQYFRNLLTVPPGVGLSRPLSQLTHREQEVLALLSNGHADKEIAGRLGISIHTVHEHVRNTFEKLGVHNRTEAVVKYLQK